MHNDKITWWHFSRNIFPSLNDTQRYITRYIKSSCYLIKVTVQHLRNIFFSSGSQCSHVKIRISKVSPYLIELPMLDEVMFDMLITITGIWNILYRCCLINNWNSSYLRMNSSEIGRWNWVHFKASWYAIINSHSQRLFYLHPYHVHNWSLQDWK